jgi:hypothetical protein
MNMYWVYDLPNWLFGLLIIATTEAIGLGGLYATRKFVRQLHRGDDSHNGIVGWYLSAICVFYGITRTSIAECRCGLPAWLWTIVVMGAFLSISVTWFFYLASQAVHYWMTMMFSALLGLLIFLLGALDNPFRGEISVSSDPFGLVYQRLMKSGT